MSEFLMLPQAEPVPVDGADGRLGFGTAFTPTMAVAAWREGTGWGPLRLMPRRPLAVDPAMVALHYGQVVFEGLKAYRHGPQGELTAFRPHAHARRMQASAGRFLLPEPPVDLFVEAVDGLTRADAGWVSDDPDLGLYLRPVLFADEPSLALRPAASCTFLVLAFVTGGFFADVPAPIAVWIEREDVRAAAGGTGHAKCAGNYAPTYRAQMRARDRGFDQVVWLDAGQRDRVEELGGMNLFFVWSDGGGRTRLSTPPLSDTILAGVTRAVVLDLAREAGLDVAEAPLSVSAWRDACASGRMAEAFACGTAAGITPIGSVGDGAARWTVGDGAAGPVTLRLREALRATQHGWPRKESS